MDRQRAGLKRWELVAIVGLLAACLGLGLWFYLPRQAEGAVALVNVDGQPCFLVDLPQEGASWTFSIREETGKPVAFEVGAEGIRFVQVDCPDHLCEQMGWCRAPGNRAVCLPNRTFLAVYDRQELPDTGDARWVGPS